MTDIDKVLEQRGSKYGVFSSHAAITQSLKKCMADTEGWARLTDSMKESLEMVAHKIGRILNGDPFYDDSWVDIEGYVHLVVNELRVKKALDSFEPVQDIL